MGAALSTFAQLSGEPVKKWIWKGLIAAISLRKMYPRRQKKEDIEDIIMPAPGVNEIYSKFQCGFWPGRSTVNHMHPYTG